MNSWNEQRKDTFVQRIYIALPYTFVYIYMLKSFHTIRDTPAWYLNTNYDRDDLVASVLASSYPTTSSACIAGHVLEFRDIATSIRIINPNKAKLL